MEQNYNGWKNRQTWNVALWINNTEKLYLKSVEYVHACRKNGNKITYLDFIKYANLEGRRTQDGTSYDSSRLCHDELDAMLNEIE